MEFIMRKTIAAFGVAGLVLVTATASFAQRQQFIHVRGTIESVDGPVLTVKTREGETVKLKLSSDAKVAAIIPATLADIKPGSFVGSAALPETGGRWKAAEVHIFAESMRGTGEGDRSFDYKPGSTMTNGSAAPAPKVRSTMTNGTVAPPPSARSRMTNGTVGGAVSATGTTTLTINYKDGRKRIDVTPDTPIVSLVASTTDELKPGAKIFVSSATPQADGTLATSSIDVGRGVAPPM
jgi:hypothetical protein